MNQLNGSVQPLLLILDLDETLIYASEIPLHRSADFKVGRYHVYRRPHLKSFLSNILSLYQVAIWTGSGEIYAAQVVDAIFSDPSALAFVWSRNKCTIAYDTDVQAYLSLKNLKKVFKRGYPKERVLIIDDSPEKVKRQYGNHIRVSNWQGDPSDNELLFLPRFLSLLNQVENVRLVEKRGWKSRVS